MSEHHRTEDAETAILFSIVSQLEHLSEAGRARVWAYLQARYTPQHVVNLAPPPQSPYEASSQ
jgi:hypothetical protein